MQNLTWTVAGNDGGVGGCTADVRNDDAARYRTKYSTT